MSFFLHKKTGSYQGKNLVESPFGLSVFDPTGQMAEIKDVFWVKEDGLKLEPLMDKAKTNKSTFPA